MQKLASLGYIGMQKSSSSAATVAGTDPKDRIATANKVIEAASARDQSKPDRAVAALSSVVASDPNLYLAQYTLGADLARKGQYAEAAKHLHAAIELQPDSAWAHYEIGATLLKTGEYKTAVVSPRDRHRTPTRLLPGPSSPRRRLRPHRPPRGRQAGAGASLKRPNAGRLWSDWQQDKEGRRNVVPLPLSESVDLELELSVFACSTGNTRKKQKAAPDGRGRSEV